MAGLLLGHHPGMPYPKTEDAERVQFIATPGSKKLYKEVAELEGLHLAGWIRATLHREAARVLEAHGRETSDLPEVHLKRPPRLQPLQPPLPIPEDGNEAGSS